MRNSTTPRAALLVAILVAGSMIATLGSPTASGREPGPFRDAALVRPTPAEQGSILIQGDGKADTTPSKALQQDLRFYAEKAGLAYEDVLARHRGINSFDGVMTDLEKRMPDTYVRAGLSGPKGSGDYWIQLTTKPSEQLVERLRSLPVDVEVNYGALASSRELAALTAALTKPMADRSDIIRSASAAYDPSSHVVTLEYIPVAGLAVASADQAAREAIAYAASTFQDNRLPVEVTLDRQDQAQVSTTARNQARGADNLRGCRPPMAPHPPAPQHLVPD